MTAQPSWSPVTPSDEEIDRVLEVLHYKVLHDGSAPQEAPTPPSAPARTRAREDSHPDNADQAPVVGESAPSDVTDGDDGEVPEAPLAARIAAVVGTPEFFDTARPSLSKGWEYARHGAWTGDGVPARIAGCTYAAAVMPVRVVRLYAGLAAGYPHGGSGDVWNDDRPAVAEAWNQAMARLRADDSDNESVLSDIVGVWLFASAVIRAVLAAADWTVERPSRLAVALVLAWLTGLPPF